jgi:hypothetical protein
VYVAGGTVGQARAAFRRALELADDQDRQVRALRALALLERRSKRHDDAARCWRELMDFPACPPHIAREAARALAIHHEHRVRDLETARTFALGSLRGLASGADQTDVRHRLARIERKLEAAKWSDGDAFLWSS